MVMEIKCHADFAPVIKRFVESEVATRATLRSLANAGAKSMQSAARAQLRQLVYMAPLPSSVDPTKENDYYAHDGGRRTGRAWDSIKTSLATTAGDMNTAECYVDEGDYPAYFYAMILNYGGQSINYVKRPFWTRASLLMQGSFVAMGDIALRSIRDQLDGRGTGALNLSELSGGAGLDVGVVANG